MINCLRLFFCGCLLLVVSGSFTLSISTKPVITSLSPAFGPVGTVVTIQGSSFHSIPASNAVYFGAVRATVTGASPNQLTVVVPAGATSITPVTVTNLSNNLSGSSITASTPPAQFTVTFSNGIVNSNSYVKTDYAVGSGPRGIVAADFDGDGKTDLATTNFTSNDISILLRNAGNTGFETETRLTGGSNPEDVTVGDFDGNGRFDLAFLNKSTNTVSVMMRNAANDGFDSPIDLSVGNFAQSLVAGDFNDDGKTDLAVTVTPGSSSGKLWIFLRNSSNSGFNIPSSTLKITITATPQGMTTGDFNHDGLVDMALAEAVSGDISVLYQNTSSALFGAPVKYNTGGTSARTVAVGDFNADGQLDLVVSALSGTTSSVSLLLRKADNSGFDSPLSIGETADAYGLVVGDFNGDGRADVAETNFPNNLVGIYLWDACNAFLAPPVNFSVGIKPWDMVTGDFDGDGMADLASVNYGSDQVSVLTYQAQAPTIKTVTLAPLSNIPGCKGDPLTLSFTKTGTFNNCETFTAQLSEIGSTTFANPTLLGTRSQSPIKTALPADIAPGTYQIRIVSSSGVSSNTSSLTVISCVKTIQVSAFLDNVLCQGSSQSLSFTTSGPFAANETFTAQLSNPGSSTFPTMPVVLGSGNTSPIAVVIPAEIQPGTYSIRIVSSGGVVSNSTSLVSKACPQNCVGNFTWAKIIGENPTAASGAGVSTDSQGNSYLLGDFYETLNLGGITLTGASSSSNIFLAKYNSAGAVAWAKYAGTSGYGSIHATSIDTDPTGNSYLTGYFSGEVAFDGEILVNGGSQDIFIAKYNVNGALQWVKRAGGDYNYDGNTLSSASITADRQGGCSLPLT